MIPFQLSVSDSAFVFYAQGSHGKQESECNVFSSVSSFLSPTINLLTYLCFGNHTCICSPQIFNSKLVLASPETATDADYAAILGVIGHEVKIFVFVAENELNCNLF